MHDKFSPVPNGVTYFDGFFDGVINPDFWTELATGTVDVSENVGNLTILHDAGGLSGYGHLTSIKRFGWQTTISVDLTLTTGSAGADGNHAEASLVLYKDATHYIKFGPYRDTAAGKNHISCLRYKMGGAETVSYIGANLTDALLHTYSIIVLGDHAVLKLDGTIISDFETIDFVDYYIQLEIDTTANADHIHATFTNFICAKSPNMLSSSSSMGTLVADIATIDGKVDIIDNILDAMDTKITFSGNITLPDTTPVELTFDTATYGSQFELSLAAALLRGTVPKAVVNDGGVYTDKTSECNSMITRNIKLLPSVPANNDAFIVMAASKFCYIDIYMEGGVFNTNNTFAIKYWNGAWTAIPGVVDGTFDTKSLGKSGRVSFSPPADWATTTINGYTGYAVEFVVTTFGTDVPYASHVQVGLDNSSGFDQVAQEFSNLSVYIKRNFPTITYQDNPGDALTYVQGIGHRDIDLNGLRCYSDTKIGFQLAATPDKTVVIPYFGFTKRL
jgi:hypothetical protein